MKNSHSTTKTRGSFYTQDEMDIALSNRTIKEMAELLPGRSEKSILMFRANYKARQAKGGYKKLAKRRKGSVLNNTAPNEKPKAELTGGQKAALTRKKNLKRDKQSVVFVEPGVEKPRNLNLVVDGVTITVDRLVRQVIISKDNIIVNR